MVALSLNLVVGETGMISVAQAAFSGIGAYVTALLLLALGINFFLAVILSMLAAGAIAFLVGAIFTRLQEVYYVFGTVGFNVILYTVLLNWNSVTRGPLGIPGIPRPELFGFIFSDNHMFLGLALASLAAIYGLCTFIKNSSFGRVLHAIREDEEATSVFGYATHHYKLAVFTIAAMFTAYASGLYATYISYIDPSTFALPESIFILAMIILGGLSSTRGAVLGAFLLVILPEALRFVGFPSDIAAQMRQMTYGLVLVLLMLYRPQGILGKFRI
ncbi:hypothetical protein A3C20_02985 [Candidatus Kaiserbacteria bacterium RIFCSPHIGHO2_02_FULL_55_25]|uniref:Branched-chain amino acid ABC transporter permease n=1 Tax=Candidatus Kaiserbacteria bacterium RIFCSPHIGHO2_02_FULL_55_25 TaxID=1798498 RepID=A0A1F6E6G5_9BACT|nr:MAG: hypothetical protein A2764_01120 [Candidatus Kaiserbacteria bacterium RIFCSPHIGHO2_01_FULL_55_79]OGG69289.1 MAG: hypothetical protein A3C20_02985 [Candidatus Kaiserbacteria bacterium RIFCSPHIGHO2_02_FULL_55_25]OGG78674.1 MAG: hypothetical protein A3F56_03500 [Candidatus Kaiserbacteria bacterium RIFCSPHIGHO2_12_FULL_55_13]OGG83637.1 MAG: hypothetical protein A3A42_00465 [Candidatus Kaiserbacteria bacterium RIFCSPLOWO2_01_FULL_55_25]